MAKRYVAFTYNEFDFSALARINQVKVKSAGSAGEPLVFRFSLIFESA